MQEMEINVNDNLFCEEIEGQIVIKKEYEEKLKELKQNKDNIERELKTLSLNITNELKERFNTTERVGEYNFVVKGGNYTFEFDMDSFMNDHLELYIQYLKPKENKITYQLVSATRGKKNVQ